MPSPSGGGRTLNRDFKDVRRHTAVAAGHAFSGWVGLGVGLSVGLAVALAVHLHYRGQAVTDPQPVPAEAPAPASEVATDESVVGSTPTGASGTEFDFYDMLPKQEVEVPEPAAGRTAQTTPLPTGDAMLQAGSFKQSTEAERMVAKLALHGIGAKIQRASVDDETWYRVRIGPIETVEELRVIQAKLLEADINVATVTPREDMPLP